MFYWLHQRTLHTPIHPTDFKPYNEPALQVASPVRINLTANGSVYNLVFVEKFLIKEPVDGAN